MRTTPTLLVLAAGMATRYGSLKQLDSFGPHGETIIDYSVHDALKAGFGKIVFVIRESIREEFEGAMRHQFPTLDNLFYVTQELDHLPAGYQVPENRIKPWGTGHAVWVASSHIQGPFAVINGDDFYGYRSFGLVVDFLRHSTSETEYGLIGFKLENTLSEHGAVSRGLCQLDEEGYLEAVTEQTHIIKTGDGIEAQNPDQEPLQLTGQELVSMNLMVFKPSVFPLFEQGLKEFLEENSTNPNAEFYLPAVVDHAVKTGRAQVKVLETPEKWFGVTYPDDKAVVMRNLQRLVHEGTYPQNLRETHSANSI
ncbi:sugar phosphate nucleotidyltransferase [Rufibacter glacialis]|uniref:Nucleotidyltransferase n=1 Tax=Rufibacter glacialis TaxID=1259555 RepID=A0A5M8Q974_9BACT|nr:sugar phosphate nucleotidyltransferase [Rufibacter glacialis]KAA6432439.1 nucleotidyltransferase [Rufibacter glacialis]GGK78668.1 nucleotidyltransferase [Rufibacter glacialis]